MAAVSSSRRVGCGTGIDRPAYVKKNVAVFESLPRPSGAPMIGGHSAPYYTEENGPVEGYTTVFLLRMPPQMSLDEVVGFYRARLAPKWKLVERLDGPVLNFERASASLSVNLESFRARIIELDIDHDAKFDR